MACTIMVGAAPQAVADFQLQPSPVPPSESAQVPIDKAFPGADQGNEPARPDPRRHLASPVAPRFRAAAGFGQGVPLAFAARQIVPPAVAVRFGPGVDPESSVDWIGGRRWNRVLAAAIAPLGLHLTVSATAALISR
jgi:hypothetical protein